MLSHFGDACLTNVSKKKNADEVERLTGVRGYSANQDQIKEIVDMIHYSSLDDFKNRLRNISTHFEDMPSTNFLVFLERFESSDCGWVDDINSLRK